MLQTKGIEDSVSAMTSYREGFDKGAKQVAEIRKANPSVSPLTAKRLAQAQQNATHNLTAQEMKQLAKLAEKNKSGIQPKPDQDPPT